MNMQTYATYQVLQSENAVRSHVDDMYKAVLDAGWDGEWFLRAYDAPKAVRLVHMNVKMDRYTLNHRASVLWQACRCQRRTRTESYGFSRKNS